MGVDASAMAAMLTEEPGGDRLARILEGAPTRIASAIAIYETALQLTEMHCDVGRRLFEGG